MLAASVLLGVALGPVAQGVFSRAKAEIEFVGALMMFGLPQSMFFFVQCSRLTISRAKSFAVGAGAIAACASILYSRLSLHWSAPTTAVFSAAAFAFVWCGLLRAVVLSAVSTRFFNIITALPQLLLLGYAIVASALGRVANLDVSAAFAMAFVISGFLATRGLKLASTGPSRKLGASASTSQIMRYGVTSGFAAVASTLALLLVLRVIHSRLGAANMGIYALAATVSQGLLIPLNYAVPLLFKAWMQRPPGVAPLRGGLLATLSLCTLSALAYWFSDCKECTLRLGPYAPIGGFLWILILGSATDACHKIIAVAANACGSPWLPAVSEGVRVIGIAVSFVMLPTLDLRQCACVVSVAAGLSAFTAVALYWWRTMISKERIVCY